MLSCPHSFNDRILLFATNFCEINESRNREQKQLRSKMGHDNRGGGSGASDEQLATPVGRIRVVSCL